VFIVGNLIEAIAVVIDYVLWAYIGVIIAHTIISWVSPDPFNPIVRFLYRVTEPVLRPIRHRLPTLSIGIDLSPMVVILAIFFLDSFLISTLRDLALSLR
jgi:YggT family protein